MKSLIWITITTLGIAWLSSCATVMSGPTQRVYFVSDTPAVLVVDGEVKDSLKDGIASIVKFRRKTDPQWIIEVQSEGFLTERVELKRKFNEISTLNAFNVLGWILDLYTSSIWRYSQPDTIHLTPAPKTR
jgi:Uma2 family endonuclease